MRDDENNKATKMKKGDTLDYYNDAIPKRAVESLFDKRDKTSRPSDDDYEDDYPPENEPERNVIIQERLAYKERTGSVPEPPDELEDQISMRPRQRSDRPRRDVYAAEEKFRQGIGASLTGDVPANQTEGQTHRQRQAAPEDLPRRRASERSGETRDHTRRAPTDDMPRSTYSTDDPPRRPPADTRSTDAQRRRTGTFESSTRTRAASSRLFNEEELDGDFPLSIKTVIIGGVSLLVLTLFVVLIVRINSLNKKVSEAQDSLSETTDVTNQLQLANITIDNLNTQIKDLQEENKILKESGPQEEPTDPGQQDPNNPATPPEGSNITPPPSTEPTPGTTAAREHTVVGGDTLSKIATQYYGSSTLANINKIKDANNLTSDIINTGKVLKIP